MYKLLIVEDEPLVQVGIKSMLNWADLNIALCGVAANGKAGLDTIEKEDPDIVITDIKMPIMSGLDLIRTCRDRYGNGRPSFIILTNYEDFQMAKEALRYQVTDYLVKIELTADSLKAAVDRVLKEAAKQKNAQPGAVSNMQALYDKFFIRLLNNLFDSREQFLLQSAELHFSFDNPCFVCCYLEILRCLPGNAAGSAVMADASEANMPVASASEANMPDASASGANMPDASASEANMPVASASGAGAPAALPEMSLEKQAGLFGTALQMLREIVVKYMPCHVVSLDLKHCAILFCCKEEFRSGTAEELKRILAAVSGTLRKYYNVTLKGGIGSPVKTPLEASDSYQFARQAFSYCTGSQPILYIEECSLENSHSSLFNISLFKDPLRRAIEEFDAETLDKIITQITELFLAHPSHYVQALDFACNILYLTISLLPDGEELMTGIFSGYPDGYRSIYKQSTVEQIVDYLRYFRDQLCLVFRDRKKEHRNHIVANVKKYIASNVREHLTLNEVAAVFGISPNYLSQIFKKYSDMGFNEYVTGLKIAEAKSLMADSSYRIYEIADMLGFESAFYFSKVFKKVEGISPTEYQNRRLL